MNNPNPFLPQGSLVEQKNRKRARLKTAVFSLLGINFLLVVGVLLIQGCGNNKTGETAGNSGGINTNTLPDTGLSPIASNTNTNPITPPDTAISSPAASNSVPPPLPGGGISNPPPNGLATSGLTPPGRDLTPVANPVPPAGPTSEYVVAKGDLISTIAKKVHVSSKAILAANPTVVPTKLKVGQKLVIPSASVATAPEGVKDSGAVSDYVVKPHDTLTKIAHTHGTTVKAIRAENHLKTDAIKVGDKLKLPVKSAPPAAAETTPATASPTPVYAASNITAPSVTTTSAPVVRH